MKQVIQLDKDRYFIGVTSADESPLEPDVFLLPANAVDAEPPMPEEGKRAKWTGQWVYEDIPQPEPEPEPEPPTTEEKLQFLENARKQQEDIGVTIDLVRYSGSQVNRQLLNEAIQFATTNNIMVFPMWKDSDNVYHPDHPVASVQVALNAIGFRRSQLIGIEATYASQITTGAPVNIDTIDWS